MELIDTAHKPHDTRHTCISLLSEKEVSLTIIKKLSDTVQYNCFGEVNVRNWDIG